MFISFSHDINYNSDSLVSRNNSPYETNNNAIHFLTFYFHSEIKTMGKEQLEASLIIATTRKEKCQCLLNKHQTCYIDMLQMYTVI